MLRPRREHDLTLLSEVQVETGFRPDHDHFSAMTTEPNDVTDIAIVFATRHRKQTMGLIADALARIKVGGWLVVDGQKTDGIDSLRKQVRGAFELSGTASKAHGKVFWLKRPETLPSDVGDWQKQAELTRNNDGFWTAPGMFSPEHIDPGTALLIQQFSPELKGRVADLGAGWGALSAALLNSSPDITQLDLYEAERAALDAAKQNIDDPRADFLWRDVTALTRPTEPYDLVIANPPFHQGRAAEPEIGRVFVTAAAKLLKPKGRALFVANRQLPYEATIDRHFRKRSEIALAPGYKVVSASGPKSTKP